ncbi:hypothetical protein LC724_26480 [Blautia sp. RD014234]|nr:hypothetical protein [Blautia parvula]
MAQNDKAETKSEQVSDQAVKTFRKKVETKSEGKKQTKNTSVFRTASVCMMVAVLAVGVLYLNDYHKLKKTETVISKLDDKNSGKELVETKPVNGLVSENRKKDSQDAADGEAAGTDTEETDAGTDGAATSESSDGTSDGQKDTDGKKTMQRIRMRMTELQRKRRTAAAMHQGQMQRMTAKTVLPMRRTAMTGIPARQQAPHTSPTPFTRATP